MRNLRSPVRNVLRSFLVLACALAAIIAPGVLAHDRHVTISWGNQQLWALLAATVVFARTRNMMAMMVVGMGVFTVLRLVG